MLYLNGKSLIKLPYFERRHILSQNVGEIPLTKQIITDKPVHAASFLEEAIVNGHEGLMAKKQTAFTHLDEEEDVG